MLGTSTSDIVVGAVLITNGLALAGFAGYLLWKVYRTD